MKGSDQRFERRGLGDRSRRILLERAAGVGTSAIVGAAWPLASRAQPVRTNPFPTQPVRLVLPQPPGGAADRLARQFAEELGARWNQTVIVDNRPGGGVIIGTSATVRAAPDGHTIGLLGSSLSINAVQRNDLPYDARKDLQPIARIGYYTMVLVARADFAADDVNGLIALDKRNPGSLSFGSNGIGTSAQLAGDLLNFMAGTRLQHVPYNGAAKMYTDMLGGQIPIGFGVASSAEPFIKARQLKALAVTSARRSPLYPDWPAIAETLPGFEAVNWAGFAGPAALPDELTRRIADDILAVAAGQRMREGLREMGIEYAPQGPAEFKAFIASEIERFGKVTQPIPTGGKS